MTTRHDVLAALDSYTGGPWCILPAPDGTGGYPRTVDVVKARMAAS